MFHRSKDRLLGAFERDRHENEQMHNAQRDSCGTHRNNNPTGVCAESLHSRKTGRVGERGPLWRGTIRADLGKPETSFRQDLGAFQEQGFSYECVKPC